MKNNNNDKSIKITVTLRTESQVLAGSLALQGAWHACCPTLTQGVSIVLSIMVVVNCSIMIMMKSNHTHPVVHPLLTRII